MSKGDKSGNCLKEGLSMRETIEKGSGVGKPGPTGRQMKEARKTATKGK
jgi:hypothetical protein